MRASILRFLEGSAAKDEGFFHLLKKGIAQFLRTIYLLGTLIKLRQRSRTGHMMLRYCADQHDFASAF